MRFLKLVFAVGVALPFAAGSLFAQGSVIVNASPGNGATVSANYVLNIVRTLDSAGDVRLASFPDNDSLNNFLTAAATDPLILSAELDQKKLVTEADPSSASGFAAAATSLDPLVLGSTLPVNFFGNTVLQGYVQQPISLLIHLPDAQAAFGAGNGVVVADIDTGVDAAHPGLQNAFVQGYDFIADQAGIPSDFADLDPATAAALNQLQLPVPATSTQAAPLNQSTAMVVDPSSVELDKRQSTVVLLDRQSTVVLLDSSQLPGAFGHGTMVSGLIHLVAPGAMIMPLRAFQADGTGNLSDIVRAIYYATDHGAQVINMSFDSSTESPALHQALRYARHNHVICVASAGNAATTNTVFPAAYSGVIGIGSTNAADLRSMFSNYGDQDAQAAAPGEALVTMYPGGNYAGVWGTSFSAALVSGSAALAAFANSESAFYAFKSGLNSGVQIPNRGLGNARLDVLPLLQTVAAWPDIDDVPE